MSSPVQVHRVVRKSCIKMSIDEWGELAAGKGSRAIDDAGQTCTKGRDSYVRDRSAAESQSAFERPQGPTRRIDSEDPDGVPGAEAKADYKDCSIQWKPQMVDRSIGTGGEVEPSQTNRKIFHPPPYVPPLTPPDFSPPESPWPFILSRTQPRNYPSTQPRNTTTLSFPTPSKAHPSDPHPTIPTEPRAHRSFQLSTPVSLILSSLSLSSFNNLLSSTRPPPELSREHNLLLLEFFGYSIDRTKWSTPFIERMYNHLTYRNSLADVLDSHLPDFDYIRRNHPLGRVEIQLTEQREFGVHPTQGDLLLKVQGTLNWLYGIECSTKENVNWLLKQAPPALLALVRHYVDLKRFSSGVQSARLHLQNYFDYSFQWCSASPHERRAKILVDWLNLGKKCRWQRFFQFKGDECGVEDAMMVTAKPWSWFFDDIEAGRPRKRFEVELTRWEEEAIEREKETSSRV
ncbi:hypothetical protein JCM3765_004103 [Sporobolomyces pararoseus]